MARDVQFSAVIPTFNRAGTLGRAIESILRQERGASEILVVDDGSADDTRRLISQYGQRVRYIYQDNQGVSAARNRGVSEGTYPWIAFLDSDDQWLPGHLARIGAAIEETDAQAAVYFSDLQVGLSENTRYWDLCGLRVAAPFELALDASEWVCMRTQPMMLQASVIKKDIYLKLGGLPVSLKTREDTLLFFKLGLMFPACAVCGCGTIMMDDGKGRLTQEFHGSSIEYSLASVAVFSQLVSMAKTMRHRKHKTFVEELGYAHFGLSRAYYRKGRYLVSLGEMLRSVLASPRSFRRCLYGSLGVRLSRRMA